jgi:hypothetical protein
MTLVFELEQRLQRVAQVDRRAHTCWWDELVERVALDED